MLNESVILLEIDNQNLQTGIMAQVNETNKYKAWYNQKKGDYNNLFQKSQGMEDALGKWPFIFIGAIFLTIILILLWDRRKTLFKPKPIAVADAHRELGYTKEAGILDKLMFWKSKEKKETSSKPNNTINFDNQNNITNLTNENNVTNNTNETKKNNNKNVDEKIKKIHIRIDNLEQKHNTDIQDLRKKVDNIISIISKKEGA